MGDGGGSGGLKQEMRRIFQRKPRVYSITYFEAPVIRAVTFRKYLFNLCLSILVYLFFCAVVSNNNRPTVVVTTATVAMMGMASGSCDGSLPAKRIPFKEVL